MRVKPWEANLAAAASHRAQARVGQSAVLAQPEPRQVGVPVAGASPQVAVQGLAGAAAERQGPLAAALAQHQEDVELQVDVGELDPDHLGPAGTGVEQQHEQGGIASALEVLPAQAWNRRLRASSGTIGTGCSGTMGFLILAIGLAGISSSSASQP